MKKFFKLLLFYIKRFFISLFYLIKIIIFYINRFLCRKKLKKILSSVGVCSTFFGLPGAGKTSFCAYIVYLVKHANLSLYDKKPLKIYSNVPIKGAIEFSKDDFGKYDFSNSIILIDEGSLYYDSRQFKDNFNQQSLEYLKLLRHRHNHLFIFSQSLDVDIKFIRLSQNIYQIKNALFGFTRISLSKRKVDIDENTHKWEDFYYKMPGPVAFFTDWRFWRRKYYKMFDSYEAPTLPVMVEIEY